MLLCSEYTTGTKVLNINEFKENPNDFPLKSDGKECLQHVAGKKKRMQA